MATAAPGLSLAHRYADLGDVRLHYVEAGRGPLVVLLHGFPEFWYSWRHQIPALAAAGFRVVAPDMRGYNLSDKPRGARSYRVEVLARDVARLIEACGARRAMVVGHDWGAGVAWALAMRYPALLERLVIMNVPHPAHFMRGMQTPHQLLRSWYVFFFQLPWLPEAVLRAGRFRAIRRAFQGQAAASTFSDEDVRRYVEALAQPGALTGAINYYRALLRQSPIRARRELRRIDTPVLVIWGERDPYLGPELAEPDRAWVPCVDIERIPDAGHWVQMERPERVNERLIAFLREA